MLRKHLGMALALLAGCTAAASAYANPRWPLSIVGTWKGISNQSPVTLTITSQTAGSTMCDNISGTIKDITGNFTNVVSGFYCPSSGNVNFMRLPNDSNAAFQVYNASVSQISPPAGVKGILMGGTFSQYNTAYGPLGQYSFSLTN